MNGKAWIIIKLSVSPPAAGKFLFSIEPCCNKEAPMDQACLNPWVLLYCNTAKAAASASELAWLKEILMILQQKRQVKAMDAGVSYHSWDFDENLIWKRGNANEQRNFYEASFSTGIQGCEKYTQCNECRGHCFHPV
ncbi:MAG TPA: hypothetical protein IAB46_09965 [Candidatus Scybalocola faecigallinarum]|uniref:Uncharacterized protein n=1 Tax=Candidatus Scybalocola faecigallinarum TaxID=2840941 RepID=A0A9D1F5I0_9FIRM|nr:hypothetical protein [Candidatus Scybalocola faecigallinarum]